MESGFIPPTDDRSPDISFRPGAEARRCSCCNGGGARHSCCRMSDRSRSRAQSLIQPPRTLCRINPALLRMRASERGIYAAERPTEADPGLYLDPATSHALQDESCAPTHARIGARHSCCRTTDRSGSRAQSLIQPPCTLCRMNPALLRMRARSAAFMLQNDRPKVIQGFILDPATSNALQDESVSMQ